MTKLILQKAKTDCGVACLAMLCDVLYDEAKNAINWHKGKKNNLSTTTQQLHVAALKLGYSIGETARGDLKLKVLPFNIENPWGLIPDNSLVKIPGPGRKKGWHWIVWKHSHVFDPAHGIFEPIKYPFSPSSYLHFIRKEKNNV